MNFSKLITIFILTFSMNFLNANEIKKDSLLCNTIEECEKLSLSIQTQIDELKNKGFKNLSKEEKLKYVKLNKKISKIKDIQININQETIAQENEKQRIENEKQKNQDKTIAQENEKQKNMREDQNKKIEELKGILLSK